MAQFIVIVILSLTGLVAFLFFANRISRASTRPPETCRPQTTFTKRKICNSEQSLLFNELQTSANEVFKQRVRVFPNMPYSLFLLGRGGADMLQDEVADFVIVDYTFRVLAVIDYKQALVAKSTGNCLKASKEHDAMKRAALISASIPLCEIPETFNADSVRDAMQVTHQIFKDYHDEPNRIRD